MAQRWRTIGRRLRNRLRNDGVRLRGRGSATPVELRVHLPLLWPEGPDGPVDQAAVRMIGRDYARAGRGMDELLADLDILCAVVGISATSGMIEASSVAWSDTLLDVVVTGSPHHVSSGDQGPGVEAALSDVVSRLHGMRVSAWGDLVPEGHLLVVACVPERDPVRLGAIAEAVRGIFPEAVVALQPEHHRVVAAVAGTTTEAQVASLRSRCAELVTAATPTVTLVEAPTADEIARHLPRSAS